MQKQRMILCAGLQSGGTTLVSWCFLQRGDTNGVLDMPSDVIQVAFDKVTEPIVWCKTTVASYRWLDVCETYRDLGWNPEPLLVARDVRATYASLIRKWYGFNGTTAEDPPLRMRFRRFLADWQLFRDQGWPILKYEDLIDQEDRALVGLCAQMSLDWDESMASWPKQRGEIAYVGKLNETFERSMEKGSLAEAKIASKATISSQGLPTEEIRWLDELFGDYNRFHGYPANLRDDDEETRPFALPSPRYEGTIRDWLYSERDQQWAEIHRLNTEIEALRARAAGAL
jgi:hypothetical protein